MAGSARSRSASSRLRILPTVHSSPVATWPTYCAACFSHDADRTTQRLSSPSKDGYQAPPCLPWFNRNKDEDSGVGAELARRRSDRHSAVDRRATALAAVPGLAAGTTEPSHSSCGCNAAKTRATLRLIHCGHAQDRTDATLFPMGKVFTTSASKARTPRGVFTKPYPTPRKVENVHLLRNLG